MPRIAFVTPCLRPFDGIADYVRRLAVELVRMGHEVSIFVLNEEEASLPASEKIVVDDQTIEVHRWYRTQSYASKCAEARSLLEAFAPDWVSLQFEFRLYAERGLIHGAAWHLPGLLRGFPVQLFMHELWTSLFLRGEGRERLKGAIRYAFFWLMVKRIAPARAHTSSPPYVAALRELLPEIRLLPVFSNIRVWRDAPAALPREFSEAISGREPDYFLVLIFGIIKPAWQGGPAMDWVVRAGEGAGKKILLVSLGDHGYGDSGWRALLARLPEDARVVKLGFRDEEFVSWTLQRCHLAISHTPFELSTKSGTTSAFLEHGLPVLFSEKRPSVQEIDEAYRPPVRELIRFADDPTPPEVARPHLTPDGEPGYVLIARRLVDDLTGPEH